MKEIFKKLLKFIKKHWFILTVIFLCLLRFLLTYKLPNFYLSNLDYDDGLMIRDFSYLKIGSYLGPYFKTTLIKGPIFPFIMLISFLYKINYSTLLTILYIGASIYFMRSLKHIANNKKFLIIVLALLLFNPVTYSQDLFQRLYRNSISITELLFFLGSVIRVLFCKNKKVYNYILFGLSLSFLFLTREDNIWTYPVILFVFIYNVFKERRIKIVLKNLIPILILVGSLNLISYINYKNYGIYTYNEIQKSEFHNTYKKILQIKDDEKISMVSIPKSTLYKLSDNSKSFGISRDRIDYYYNLFADKDTGEIYNGNIIWYFRDIVFCEKKFTKGSQSEEYYKELGKDIDRLFEEGVLEKEFVMPSSFMAVPTKKDLVEVSKNLIYAIGYTSSYENIKTLTDTKDMKYKKEINAYSYEYPDYHNTINIVEKNDLLYEIIRQIYKYFTIIFSIIGLYLYIRNIKNRDNISIFNHLLLLCYLLIMGGTVYTHVTSFHAIRPLYLGNIYIIQMLFILLNLYKKVEKCKLLTNDNKKQLKKRKSTDKI